MSTFRASGDAYAYMRGSGAPTAQWWWWCPTCRESRSAWSTRAAAQDAADIHNATDAHQARLEVLA